MALKLYAQQFDDMEEEIDGVDYKITAYHDSTDGSYKITSFYLTNEPANLGYSNIEVSIVIDGQEGTGSIVSTSGIVYQLAAVDTGLADISPEFWESIPYGNSITVNTIQPLLVYNVETEQLEYTQSVRNFILRTYVPRGIGVNYITEASLKVTAVEFQEA